MFRCITIQKIFFRITIIVRRIAQKELKIKVFVYSKRRRNKFAPPPCPLINSRYLVQKQLSLFFEKLNYSNVTKFTLFESQVCSKRIKFRLLVSSKRQFNKFARPPLSHLRMGGGLNSARKYGICVNEYKLHKYNM